MALMALLVVMAAMAAMAAPTSWYLGIVWLGRKSPSNYQLWGTLGGNTWAVGSNGVRDRLTSRQGPRRGKKQWAPQQFSVPNSLSDPIFSQLWTARQEEVNPGQCSQPQSDHQAATWEIYFWVLRTSCCARRCCWRHPTLICCSTILGKER